MDLGLTIAYSTGYIKNCVFKILLKYSIFRPVLQMHN